MQKITRSPSYLIRNPHSYCFRMVVPKDVQPYVGKRELRYSLRTGYLSTAKSKARLMAGRIQALFQEIRTNKAEGMDVELSNQQILEMVTKYLERVKAIEDEPKMPEDPNRPFENRESLNQYFTVLSAAKSDIQVQMATGNYSRVRDDAIALLNDYGIQGADIDEGSASFAKLCEGLLSAELKWLDYHKDRLSGTVSNDIEQALNSVLGNRHGVTDRTVELGVASVSVEEEPAIPLSELWEKFQKDKLDSGKWRNTTLRNHMPKYTSLRQFIGDIPVNQVTKAMIREYREMLDRLPPGFALKGYKDLTGIKPKDLDGKHNRTMDVTTVREYMNLARSLFAFAKDNDFIDENPVLTGMIPPKKKATRKLRHPFDDPNDLELVFNEERYLDWSKDRSERFWVPILALFTGCRMEEMCQLYVEDVKQIDGIWCIDIKGEIGNVDESSVNGQMLKNESAARTIPLHPILVEDLKFPEYAQEVRERGANLLFDHLEKSAKTNWKYSHPLSKSFGLYLRKKAGIPDRKKNFHSFRHTVANHLYNKTVQESIIEELEGRAGKTETRRTYTQGYQAGVLYKEAILKLDYEADLSHLKASKHVPKDTDGPE